MAFSDDSLWCKKGIVLHFFGANVKQEMLHYCDAEREEDKMVEIYRGKLPIHVLTRQTSLPGCLMKSLNAPTHEPSYWFG